MSPRIFIDTYRISIGTIEIQKLCIRIVAIAIAGDSVEHHYTG